MRLLSGVAFVGLAFVCVCGFYPFGFYRGMCSSRFEFLLEGAFLGVAFVAVSVVGWVFCRGGIVSVGFESMEL